MQRIEITKLTNIMIVSAWRNQVQAANSVVGIIISKEENKSLINIKRVTNRI